MNIKITDKHYIWHGSDEEACKLMGPKRTSDECTAVNKLAEPEDKSAWGDVIPSTSYRGNITYRRKITDMPPSFRAQLACLPSEVPVEEFLQRFPQWNEAQEKIARLERELDLEKWKRNAVRHGLRIAMDALNRSERVTTREEARELARKFHLAALRVTDDWPEIEQPVAQPKGQNSGQSAGLTEETIYRITARNQELLAAAEAKLNAVVAVHPEGHEPWPGTPGSAGNEEEQKKLADTIRRITLETIEEQRRFGGVLHKQSEHVFTPQPTTWTGEILPEIPFAIMEAAHAVANWAKKNGLKLWCIGPVADRELLKTKDHEILALLKDKERLHWLEANKWNLWFSPLPGIWKVARDSAAVMYYSGKTCRAALDAAINFTADAIVKGTQDAQSK